ncbi:MAG: cytochrome c, partial [Acidobacteria bacterium]|nr:cytochrome c [Acidobacteriota bacterium]
MRVAKLSWLTAGVAALVLTAGGAAAAGAEADTPTFTEDVAPILYENCVTCHRTGEVAPMSLITYQETRPWGRSIKNKVLAGEMPPWHADSSVGRFLNERRLTDAERDTIVAWVDAGAPEGDRAKLPPLPTFADGWQIGTPDVIIEMPEAFELPAEGEIRYQTFVAPTNFTEDKWVKAVEIRAGTPAAVHHILAYARVPDAEQRPPSFKLIPVGELAEAAARAEAERAQRSGRPARQQRRGRGTLIGSMAPGTNPMVFAPGT